MTPPRRRCTIIPPSTQDNIEANSAGAAKAAARKNRMLSERVRGMRAAGAKAYEPGHAEKREIRDAQNSTNEDGPVVRTEDTPDTGDPFIDDIYDATGYAYDYLMHVHGREGPDGLGGRLLSVIHYSEGGQGWDNAAYYRNPLNGMTELVGDGYVFPPFRISPGVHAHEWFHAFTEATCRYGYDNDEDGNCNEFVSDGGCLLSQMWFHRQTAGQYHWLIAPELFSTGLQGRALRDALIIERGPAFDDPVLGRDSQIMTYDQFRRGMDPHVGSSIGNGWLAWGSKQMPDRFAWEWMGHIFYDTCTSGRLTPGGGFKLFAQVSDFMAVERFGANSPEVAASRYGWDKVRVPIPAGPIPEPVPEPAPFPASTCTDEEIASFYRMPAIQAAIRAAGEHPVGRRLITVGLMAYLRNAR